MYAIHDYNLPDLDLSGLDAYDSQPTEEPLSLVATVADPAMEALAPDEPCAYMFAQDAPPAELTPLLPATLLGDLLRVAAELVAADNYEALLQQIIAASVAVLPPMQAGILWLYEPRVGRLRIAATHALPLEPATLAALKHCQFSPGETLIGQVFQCSDPLLLDARAHYRNLLEPLRASHEALLHLLHEEVPCVLPAICLPLHAQDEAIGVLTLVHLGRGEGDSGLGCAGTWSLQDGQLLKEVLPTFGKLVGNVIKNRQLYEQAQLHCHRLDAFDAVVTAISTATDLRDLLRSVLDVIMGLLPVSAGAIFLLDPTQARLKLGAQDGLPLDYLEAMQSFPVSGAACEEVVRYGQPTLRPLIEERDEAALLKYGLESCAYLPLLAGGTVVGVLGLYGNNNLYKQVEMTQLMPLGNQVGFAIANVRLFEDSFLERHKLTTVINSIAEGVVLCDSQGRLILANEAAMALLSLDAIPFQQPLSEMPDFYGIRDLDDTPLPVEQLPMARALSGETFHDHRVFIHGVSGDNSVMSFSGAPVRADNHSIEGAVVIFRDITAHEKLERAKDEFLAVAAHELRSPLAAVRSYAEMMLRRERQRTESDARDLRGLTILSQQVAHMLRMVDNLLDVSRLDAGQLDLQLQHINLVSLAAQVLDQQRPAAAEHELMLETEQPELLVECDSLRVRQVLTNLVSNAVKYSSGNTTITVRLTTRPISADAPALGEGDAGQDDSEQLAGQETAVVRCMPRHEAVVSVSDQGNGIHPDQQPRLFQRYYRVKNRRAEGLGLGLYLSRQFVRMHGGRIWVDSQEGKGSTFYFTLPMREEEGMHAV